MKRLVLVAALLAIVGVNAIPALTRDRSQPKEPQYRFEDRVAQFGERAEQFEENGRYFGENGFFERSPSKEGDAPNRCAHGRSVADTRGRNGIGSAQYGPEADDSGYESGEPDPTADGSAACS